jgi:rRNA maturation endonuclease Nob1
LETNTIDLARRLGGEVSVAQVQAEFKIETALALATLDSLRQKGLCQLEHRGETTVYLFKGVLPAKSIKRCPYCGSEFAVRSALHKCPNCGGNLEITKE